MTPRRWRAPVVLATVLVFGSACRARDEGARPNVLLLVVDTLRSDHLGSYGSDLGLTPHLDRFAAASVVFEDAVAQGSNTINSAPSILASVYLSEHGYTNYKLAISPHHTTMAEILAGQGYETFGVSTNPHVTDRHGLAQGFETFVDNTTWTDTDAHVVNRIFLDWLDARTTTRPFFAMLWYVDPHVPYDPPDPYVSAIVPLELRELVTMRTKRPGFEDLSEDERAVSRGLYRGEVRYLDDQLGAFMAELVARGILEDSLMILTADHGESFWERDGVDGRPVVGHGISLFEEEVSVPLLIKLPRSGFVGTIRQRVRSIDILPTVLEAAGIGAVGALAPRMQGQSLMPLARGETGWSSGAAVSELLTDASGSVDIQLRSVETDAGKLVLTFRYRKQTYDPPLVQLFEPAGDEISGESPESSAAALERTLRSELERWQTGLRPLRPVAIPSGPGDDGLRKRLEALGYVN
jgi:arylsulfatase A-like enzyme